MKISFSLAEFLEVTIQQISHSIAHYGHSIIHCYKMRTCNSYQLIRVFAVKQYEAYPQHNIRIIHASCNQDSLVTNKL